MSDVATAPPPSPPAAAERIPPPPPSHRRHARARKPQTQPQRRAEATGGGDGKPATRHASRREPEPTPPPPQEKPQERGGAPEPKAQAPDAKQEKPKPRGTSREKPTKQFLAQLPTPASFRDAAWFAASGGDVHFAQTLFGRAQGLGDASVVGDAEALPRVYRLYAAGKKVLHELQGRGARPAGGDAGDDAGDAGDDEALDTEATPPAGAAAWPVAAVAAEAREALVGTRLALFQQERERGPNAKKPKWSLERALAKELTENATELLLSRAAYDDIPVLEAWLAFVSQDPADLKRQVEGVAEEAAAAAAELPDEDAAANPSDSSKRGRKRQQKQQRQVASSADAVACDHIRVGVAFLREYHAVAAAAGSAARERQLLVRQPPPPALQVSPAVESELKTLFMKQRITEADEGERLGITQYLQQALRKGGDRWHNCQLVLFGSSLSLFGSTGSDMDLCLLRNPSQQSAAAKPVVGGREMRALLNGSTECSGSGGGDLVAVHELSLLVKKSVEKLTLLIHDLAKDGADARSHAQLKQLQQLQLVRAHYGLLQDAIQHRVLALCAHEADGQEVARAVAAAAAARRKELVAKSRRQSDDMFRVRALLERANCRVRVVISGARVPIIRFQHVPTRVDCDLCFENVLATRNTFLLRAYAECDARARVLGVAVKHWAKQRAINDASMGFLSSYSFVLLAVYFLQAAAGVLPNLQDPELLAAARVAPDVFNGVDIAFCADVAAARSFHAQQQRPADATDAPHSCLAGTLLAWFFEFYATKFDFARHVVAIRSPAARVDKRVLWGVQKTRAWRLSIQDPLETSRDLGSVLQFAGQEKIMRELKRAHEMLQAGKRFADVAAPDTPVESKAAEKKPVDAAKRSDGAADVKPKPTNRRSTSTNSTKSAAAKPNDTSSTGGGAKAGAEKPRNQAPRHRRSDRGDHPRRERAAPAQRDASGSAPVAGKAAA